MFTALIVGRNLFSWFVDYRAGEEGDDAAPDLVA